ncbi:MAG: neutral zinc metallopeptidase [Chloroflexi bacterium]|nr:neutral zinc metallopeptidase [Chloroflexota bacterium]
MNQRPARLILAAAFVLATLVNVLGSPVPVSAGHLPAPSEIVLKLAELPPGFAPAAEATSPSLLPDGLARQATASFQRDAAQDGTPGVRSVRQVVLAFDDRAASEYLPRFRDLMLRHQGYAPIVSTETDFQLTRTRGDESSIVVGVARAEVLVVTTIAGAAGTVGPEYAAALTALAVARVPSMDQSSSALSTGTSDGLALANASPGGSYFEFPSIEDKGRWPSPQVNLPPSPDLDVVAVRSKGPVRDPSLDGMTDVHPNRARPADLETNLSRYIAWVTPLIDEYWARALGQTGHKYEKPRVVIVPDGQLVLMACGPGGIPSPALSLAYCPADKTVYIYEPFMQDEMVAGQNWQQRDFVISVVMAHEWGHHIQATHGYLDALIVEMINHPELAPIITRQNELQADCFAGLYTRYARDAGWLTIGDLEEAQEAMLRAGDDHIESPGHHGLPEQRKEWFMRGYVHYSYRGCDVW